MRDGEQSPGASMTLEEKLELAKLLEDMKVDIIEAGFPIASQGDFEAVRAISQIIKDSTICGLSRAGAKDIEPVSYTHLDVYKRQTWPIITIFYGNLP